MKFSTAKSPVTPHFQMTVCDWTSFLCSSVLGKTAIGSSVLHTLVLVSNIKVQPGKVK